MLINTSDIAPPIGAITANTQPCENWLQEFPFPVSMALNDFLHDFDSASPFRGIGAWFAGVEGGRAFIGATDGGRPTHRSARIFTDTAIRNRLSQIELDAALTEDILAVAREGLSNCARHANATVVTMVLDCPGNVISLEITDNGSGVGEPTRSSGLANLKSRAERNGGTLQLSIPDGGGTQLTWTAHVKT